MSAPIKKSSAHFHSNPVFEVLSQKSSSNAIRFAQGSRDNLSVQERYPDVYEEIRLDCSGNEGDEIEPFKKSFFGRAKKLFNLDKCLVGTLALSILGALGASFYGGFAFARNRCNEIIPRLGISLDASNVTTNTPFTLKTVLSNAPTKINFETPPLTSPPPTILDFEGFVYALSTPFFGENATYLATNIESFKNRTDAIKNEAIEKLHTVNGVNLGQAESLADFFSDSKNLKVINALIYSGIKPAEGFLWGSRRECKDDFDKAIDRFTKENKAPIFLFAPVLEKKTRSIVNNWEGIIKRELCDPLSRTSLNGRLVKGFLENDEIRLVRKFGVLKFKPLQDRCKYFDCGDCNTLKNSSACVDLRLKNSGNSPSMFGSLLNFPTPTEKLTREYLDSYAKLALDISVFADCSFRESRVRALDKRPDPLNVNTYFEPIDTTKQFVSGLNIPFVGQEAIDRLANFAEEIKTRRDRAIKDLSLVGGVDSEKAKTVVDFFSDQNLLKKIKNLLALGVQSWEDKGVENQPFSGKKFYVTGKFKILPLEKVKGLVKKRGGELYPTIKTDTDFVLFGGRNTTLFPGKYEFKWHNHSFEANYKYKLIDEKRFISLVNFSLDPKNREQIDYLISRFADRLAKRTNDTCFLPGN